MISWLRTSRGFLVCCAIGLTAYIVTASVYVRDAAPNADEGFFVAAAHAVDRGLTPYIDFPYTQGPLLPYLNSILLKPIGFGVLQLRTLNAILGALGMVLVFVMLRRLGAHGGGAIAAAIVWSASASFLYFSIVGKSYAFAQLSLLLSAASLLFKRPTAAFLWIAIWGTAAVATRLTTGPAVLALWLGLIHLHRTKLPLVAAVAAPATLAGLAFLPLLFRDPSNVFFWLWDYHLHFAHAKSRIATIVQTVTLFPAVSVLAAAALWRCWHTPFSAAKLWLWAGIFGTLSNVFLSGIYSEYAAPFQALTLVGALGVLGTLQLRRTAWLTGAAVVCLAAAIANNSYNDEFVRYRPWLRPSYLKSIEMAGAFVAANTTEKDWVLSSMPEVPIAAKRPFPPELVMGKFAITVEMTREQARSLRLKTFDELVELASECAPGAVVLTHSKTWSFGMTVPRIAVLPDELFNAFLQALRQHYEIGYQDEHFVVLTRIQPQGQQSR